ncbi:hypothetical protein ACJJTC_009695 [Scirpophaga incertulas]
MHPEGPARSGKEWAKIDNAEQGDRDDGNEVLEFVIQEHEDEAYPLDISSNIENEDPNIDIPVNEKTQNSPQRIERHRRKRQRRDEHSQSRDGGQNLGFMREVLTRIELLRAETSHQIAEASRIQAENALHQTKLMTEVVNIAKGVAQSLNTYVTFMTSKQRQCVLVNGETPVVYDLSTGFDWNQEKLKFSRLICTGPRPYYPYHSKGRSRYGFNLKRCSKILGKIDLIKT